MSSLNKGKKRSFLVRTNSVGQTDQTAYKNDPLVDRLCDKYEKFLVDNKVERQYKHTCCMYFFTTTS